MSSKDIKVDLNVTGKVTASDKLVASTVGGDEGGEILLGKAVTNTTLNGEGVTIDVYQNKLRFFEQGGSARGYYIDISGGGAGVGTNLVGGGATSDSFKTISVSGQSDVVADSSTDTLTLVAGSNVTITTNATSDSITIASTDTNTTYSAGTGLTLTGTTFSVTSNTYQPLDADLTAIAGLSGTSGLLKKTSANTWTLDTSTYLTSIGTGYALYIDGSNNVAFSGFQAATGALWSGTSFSTNVLATNPTANRNIYLPDAAGTIALTSDLSSYQPLDADLTAISGLSGTSGFLKTNGAGTWSVDTASYSLTSHTHTDNNTTYSISAETVTGGANLRLTDSSAGTDDVKISAGTNMTVTRTDANTITLDSTGNYTSVDSITYPDYITFDTTPETVPTATGSIFWDTGEGTPTVILDSANGVNLQLGQENVALCYNGTGSTIINGSVVYISGAQGQRPSITLADADTEVTSSKTFGLATQDIANGAEGYVTTFGIVNNLNTFGLTEGAMVWLSSTAGGWTTTAPAEPAHLVFIGYVLKAHATSGRLFINPQNGYELTELHGVTIDGTPADNEVLAYDTSSGLWINQTSAEAGLEPTITAGTTGQYWRGDKSWQTLDKSAVGLGSVENTALSTWAGSTNITTLGTISTVGTINGTTIPTSKTLVVTTDIGSSVQAYSSTLAGITTLGSGTGLLKNTAGTWSYDTSTYYSSGGTDVALTDGGTNASLTAVAGGIVYSGASALAISAAGSSGQILRSGATGAPTWSTATFPSTATSSGTFLRADGTNWVASTLTLPNTTTANQILYSSSTSVVGQITTANNQVLVTNGSGVPSFSATLPSGVTASSLTSFGSSPTLTTPTIDSISSSAVSTAVTLYSNNTTGSIAIGAGQTTGTVTIGSTSWTANTGGAVNILQATKSPTFTTNTYTLVLTDAGKMLLASNSTTAGNVKIDVDANVNFPIGTQIHIIQTGTGQLTISATTSGTTTVYSSGGTTNSPKLRTQYSAATMIKTAANTWYVMGDIA